MRAWLLSVLVLSATTSWPAGADVPPAPPVSQEPVAEDVPPPVPTSEQKYYVVENGQSVGPFDLNGMKQRIDAGLTKPSDLVWQTGMPDWREAGKVPGLKPLLSAVPPAVPESEKIRRYVIGTWKAEWANELGLSYASTTIYTDDNKYHGSLSVTNSAGTTATTPTSGSWKVTPLDEGRFTFVLMGSTLMTGTTSSTIKMVDANTAMEEETGIVSYRQ